jgi:GNAT superfamily N-acetyltransferase
MEVRYEPANPTDAQTIADLHTQSWQRHYRGIYSDEYLDHRLADDRREIWSKRFAHPDPAMYLVKAMHDEKAVGFACTFLDYDDNHGALIDNLHVLQPYQKQGIGRQLLKLSAEWVRTHNPDSPIYLLVLDQNERAKRFYKNLQAHLSEVFQYKNPGGGIDHVLRCSWTTGDLILATSEKSL